LGDPWTSRFFGGFGFRFGLLFPCLADRPWGACGLSAWRSSSRCFSCSSRVLERFGFDPVGRAFFDRRVFGGPSARTSRTFRAARVARGLSEDMVQAVRMRRCRLGRSVSV
jgi:hypothetical protein